MTDAKQHAFTPQEVLSVEGAFGWTPKPQTALNDASEVAIEIARPAPFIHLQPSDDVYFGWSNSEDDMLDASSVWLPGGDAPIILRCPWGAASSGGSLYFHIKRVNTDNMTVNLVEN